jgi:hypothetical protein
MLVRLMSIILYDFVSDFLNTVSFLQVLEEKRYEKRKIVSAFHVPEQLVMNKRGCGGKSPYILNPRI